MHTEVKNLCKAEKWREAIDFVSRIEPGPRSGKTEDLLAIGSSVIAGLAKGKKRDSLLAMLIEAFLRLGDTESPCLCLLALQNESIRAKFAKTVQDSLLIRQWDSVFYVF